MKNYVPNFEEFLNEAVFLRTKVKKDPDFGVVADLLRDAGMEVHWAAEQGGLLFNTSSEKSKAESILKKEGWI
jgi:hypothetical protein